LADYLDHARVVDVAYTLAQRRSHFERRAAIVAAQPELVTSQLRALAANDAASGERARTRGKLAFVFPGHGPQWIGMGRALSERCPLFAEELARCDAALAPHTGFSVFAVLRGEPDAPELERVDVVQPALFAMTVALSALWRALGVEPDAVVGHSFGEIAAAHVAGALSLDDAAKVVALRARALAPLADRGGMAVVELPEAALSARLRARYAGRIEIGAYNSPSTCAVSGDADAIAMLLTELEQEAVFARRVRIRFASHSAHVESARDRILQELRDVRGSSCQLPWYSTVEGAALDGTALDAGYFYRNLRSPVRFAAAIEHMVDDGYRYFVELSPHPMLLGAIEEQAKSTVTVGSLRRDHDPVEAMYTALAQLWAAGRDLSWDKITAPGALDPALPTYAFDRQSYTREPSSSPRHRSAHGPLVQRHVESSERAGQHVFEVDIDLTDPGFRYLEGHRIVGAVWLPGAALLEMALEAGRVLFAEHGALLEDVRFERAIELPEQGITRLQLLVQPELGEGGRRSFRIVSRNARETGEWAVNAQGFMRPADESAPEPLALAQLREQCTLPIDGAVFYELLAAAGFERGASFQGVESAWRGEHDAIAKLAPLAAAEHLLHPALLDAALQGITLPTRFPSDRAFVPAGVASL
ncbi:MAG TPA: acyltransferase domain-containing protein, partial [Polyangiales bacterium]|nr:acyltransferase domain-containing protein [Polyangiales bacterium]